MNCPWSTTKGNSVEEDLDEKAYPTNKSDAVNRHIQTQDDNSQLPQKTYGIGIVKGGYHWNSDYQWKSSHLPKPEPPPGMIIQRSRSSPETIDAPAAAIGKFLRQKSSSLSAAITKRLSSLKRQDEDAVVKEFDLVGLKVVKAPKEEVKGRVSFFSRSNCRDSGAVRSFLRDRNLNFIEINVDVYPSREMELRERTGGVSVPQIFFNEKLIGGLVALNSLRNAGMLEAKLEEILGRKCPEDAPAPPVYGLDEAGDEEEDEAAEMVRVVRQRVPIQDRIMKMKLVKNCFSGSDLVEVLIHHLDCGRRKAVEIGKQLARKHFIHHIFGQNEFEDGDHFYRFLEHESFIPKCYNFRGVVNDCEPKAAACVSQRLGCLMSAIVETYASDDRRNLDFIGISMSEEFRRYVNLVEDLQRMDLLSLPHQQKLAFFLNLHNAMAMHAAVISRKMDSEFMYIVGGQPYSLSSIKNGILRNNRRPPYSLTKPFGNADKRLQLAFPKLNKFIHFGTWNATRGSPILRFFTPQTIESELRNGAREFFLRDDGMQVDLANRTVYLSRIIKWYSADFGQEKEILEWIMSFLDASKAGLLTHLLSDGGAISIVYHKYDWSLNS
ncbi:glutaredoxin-related [Striga hermonthica]|uniref:Glutaredoxin-related n=1 Tax=Striga hermonthica TaxID=68872 RepID=A0A9N7ND45_STRHE|nr:glutaredoxin-related [Striga hermonthica]